MKVVSAAEIQNIDRIAISEYGIPGAMLMEFAGVMILKVLQSKFDLATKKILIFCGKGNNGGDGLVLGRHLFRLNIPSTLFLIGKRDALSGDARLNSELLYKLSIPLVEIIDESSLSMVYEYIHTHDIIIDAIFGTGLNSPLQGLPAEIIQIINESRKTVVSVDIPSGINASTGQIMGEMAIRADLTVTMGLPKQGLLLYPGASHTGEIHVADIGFPANLLENEDFSCKLPTCEELSAWIPRRDQNAHKGTSGRLLVIAGSKGYTGAAALTCESALRAGAGLVTLAIPESLNPIMEEKLTETITYPYPDIRQEKEIAGVLARLLSLLKDVRAVAIGPGIGRSFLTQKLLKKLVTALRIPSVIDADALFPSIVERHTLPLPIFTPHPGEMARLMETETGGILGSPLQYCRDCAKKYRACVILKGSHSIISTPGGEATINTTGNPGMATAGMGDVLTGIIVGLLAQGVPPERAAVLGTFIHGLAGDFASDRIGSIGIVAGDLISRIPEVIQLLSKKEFKKIEEHISIHSVSMYN